MNRVNLVFGTVYGNAQFVAETLEQALLSQKYETKLWQTYELTGFVPPQDELLIVVCSTTGQGDIPDELQPWFFELKSTAPYLPDLQYGIVALGDSSYETFCQAGKQIDELFNELGAKRVAERLDLDACETMEPEVDALAWLKSWNENKSSELA